MTNKRTNPFLDDFVPQSKVHIGLKQFNNNEERLKNVYEKTLELLFRGAKKNSSHDNVINTGELHHAKENHHLKQLFISSDGALMDKGMMIVSDAERKVCKCGHTETVGCAYCECPLCDSCMVGCVRCTSNYCPTCILNWTEGGEVCVSCYT